MPPVNLAARKPDPALAAVLEAVVRLKACEELAQIGTWGMAVPSGEAIWSGSTYRLLGLEPDAVEPGADVFLERIHPEDRERVERICDLMLEPDGIPEERVSGECRVIRGDGSICKLRYYGRIERGDESGPAWWVGVIRDVSDGRMVERESRDEVEARARTLSEREAEILRLAAAGHSGPDIAQRLFISPGTVKTHFANIYEKLGVSDRTAAVAYALRNRLIS